MEISVSTPMPNDGNCQVIEHLEARPLRARRGWSAEAKARLVEETLVPAPMFRRLPGAPEWLRRSYLVGDVKRWQRGLRSGTGRQTPVGQ